MIQLREIRLLARYAASVAGDIRRRSEGGDGDALGRALNAGFTSLDAERIMQACDELVELTEETEAGNGTNSE